MKELVDVWDWMLAVLNLLGFCMFALDKMYAVKHKWRIPEARLLLVAALGGAFGAVISMFVFGHKTRKIKFMVCIPLFCLMHIIFLLLICK